MSFEEAMAKSESLKLEALLAIALRSPDRREKLSNYIQFNPYFYLWPVDPDAS